MNDIVEKTLLFDFYGELLTDKQKKIYSYYYLDDLSLAEISENMNISRQGVHDTLKRCEKQLQKYEDKLKLVQKFIINKSRVTEIYELANRFKHINNYDTENKEIVEKILKISKEVIDDL